MPIIKSAAKRMRQDIARRLHNQQIKKDIKAAVKDFTAKPTSEKLSKVQSEIDKAVKKGLLKKNTGARRKANIAKAAKAAGVKLESAKKETKKAAPKKTAKKAVEKKAPAKKTAAKKTTKKATK